ncbi:MAG: hypothetical protein JST21_03680 [Bacteroidetes bacterium]|nr:hypothetical protein [Bacteroidota bacterium]
MRTNLSLLSVLLFAFSFTACTKRVDVVTPPLNYSLSGSWYISDVAYFDNYGWNSYNTGLPGIFTFYNDGTAQYSDYNGTMQGAWYSNYIATGYYDKYGNYSTDCHNDFSVTVSGNGSYIDLVFDDISFAGNNRFIATYYDGKSIQRYTFNRY